MISQWDVVIGLEIHAQLRSQSKIFSDDSAEFGGGDNEHVSPVSLGMPGTLPVMNKKVIELGVRAGLALNSKIDCESVFARKNYFYPDLAKGYQISQHEKPLCIGGKVQFFHEGKVKVVNLERAHLEEDAGKSIHQGNYSLINFNRAGVPLLEIVSCPEISSPGEAAEYARAVRRILRYVEVCDGNLEEGSMRCDCNVSIKPKGQTELGTKVELKNINSFRFIEKALEFEISRQIDLMESGGEVVQETRLYDSTKNVTQSMRSKEEAQDYRYFPDPDLLPLQFSESLIEAIKNKLPELPLEKANRFMTEYDLPEQDAFFLTEENDLSLYFENTAKACGEGKMVANWIMTELLRELNDSNLEVKDSPVTSEKLAKLLMLVNSGKISGKIAKTVFAEMWKTQGEPNAIIEKLGLSQISDDNQLEEIIDEVLGGNQKQVDEYKSGKEKVFGFFVGQVMKATKGRANPETVNRLLKEKLK